MNLPWIKTEAFVKGLFTNPIPYTPLIENGDSSPYFGTYQGQRYGQWDTDDCWDFAFTECMETRLTMLEKMGLISPETLAWAVSNGYKDTDGDWYLSRRWEGILSGVQDGGNDQFVACTLAQQVGLIPNSLLPYNPSDAFKDGNKGQFNADYFNPNVITPAMRQLGQEFLKRFTIQGERLKGGYISDVSSTLVTYLKEGSLQIGVAVPQDGSWNQADVDFPIGRTQADHSVELYNFDPSKNYPLYIYDSYEPHLKQLSKNYYIPLITRLYIMPITQNTAQLPSFSPWMMIMFNAWAWITNKPLPYPDVSVGKSG